MSRVLFAGDLHIGHANVHKFRSRSGFVSYSDHEELIIENFNKYVDKRDLVYYCGDICFDNKAVDVIKKLPGRKILVRGNHDDAQLSKLVEAFEDIHGLTQYKYAWVSHAPMHPNELYGKMNIHGHVHYNTLPDDRYVNVSLENIGFVPIDYRAIIYYKSLMSQGLDMKLQDHIYYPTSEFDKVIKEFKQKPTGNLSDLKRNVE